MLRAQKAVSSSCVAVLLLWGSGCVGTIGIEGPDAGADVTTSDASTMDGNVVESDIGTDVTRNDSMLSMDARMDARLPLPDAGNCHEQLRALGLTFTVAGPTRGVVDPVMVTTPINDVHFRYSTFTAEDRPLLMDCRLGVALHSLTRELRDRWNITDLVHLGIYNYRCIAGTDPCRLSQHATATAIDINSLRDRNGQRYSVTTDFVANGSPTCPPRSTNPIDALLKDVACWMYDSRTFNIILTPNYNAAHRDHYHVDLTSGSHFIGIEPPSGVDPEVSPGVANSFVDDD